MTVLGTYELPNGEWQTLAQFESERDARECLSFHAQGRRVKLSANCPRPTPRDEYPVQWPKGWAEEEKGFPDP